MTFIDSYNLHMVTRNIENGEIQTEEYGNISLSDFEVIYGNTINEILSLSINKLTPEEE